MTDTTTTTTVPTPDEQAAAWRAEVLELGAPEDVADRMAEVIRRGAASKPGVDTLPHARMALLATMLGMTADDLQAAA